MAKFYFIPSCKIFLVIIKIIVTAKGWIFIVQLRNVYVMVSDNE